MFNRLKRLFMRQNRDKKPSSEEINYRTLTGRSGGEQVSHDSSQEQSPEPLPENKTGTWPERGMVTRTCKKCGKTFTLPEEVQHWPDYCQECRRKYKIVDQVTRKCRGCGKEFTFPSNIRHWPNYCRECQENRKSRKQNQNGINPL